MCSGTGSDTPRRGGSATLRTASSVASRPHCGSGRRGIRTQDEEGSTTQATCELPGPQGNRGQG